MEQHAHRSAAAQALIDQAISIQAERDRLRERCRKLEEALKEMERYITEVCSETEEGILTEMREVWPAEWKLIDQARALLHEKE